KFFSILLLNINPKFDRKTYTHEKPKLHILIDNSGSVTVLGHNEKVIDLIKKIKENEKLNSKFDISFFSFGSEFRANDNFSFSEKNTNISQALSSVNEIFKNRTAPTILITDGNQTLGNDYEFSSAAFENPIYPVILGDTIQ